MPMDPDALRKKIQAVTANSVEGFVDRSIQRMKSVIRTITHDATRFKKRYSVLERSNKALQAENRELVSKNACIEKRNQIILTNLAKMATENAALPHVRLQVSELERTNSTLRHEIYMLEDRISLDPTLVLTCNDVVLEEGTRAFRCPISHERIEKAVLFKCGHVAESKVLYELWERDHSSFGTCPNCKLSTSVIYTQP